MKIVNVANTAMKKLTVLIHGRQGSGKTLLGSTIAENTKTLLLDSLGERGTETLRALPYAKNLDVVPITKLSDLNEAYNHLAFENHAYKAIIIDSFTGLQGLCRRFISEYEYEGMADLENDIRPFRHDEWGKMLNMMAEVIDRFYGLASSVTNPLHVIGIAQSNVRGDRLDPDEEKELLIAPALQGAAYDKLLMAPDYIMYTFIEEDLDNYDNEPKMKYLVRIGGHPVIVTKVRTDPERNIKLPAVIGNKHQVTIPKFAKLIEKPL